MAPKVSVLVPTYNYARFLPEAIESVLAQSFRDFEMVIVDDCSKDGTARVVEKFCQNDPRVRFLVNQTNLGMVKNWNHCLSLARGDYVKFLFGDDTLIGPQALGKWVAMLDNHRDATLAAAGRIILDENSKWIDQWVTFADGVLPGREAMAGCLLRNHNLIGEPSAVLFRRADAQRGFDANYRQLVDEEMWFHLLEKGNLVYTREPLCGFRRHAGQQTEVNNAVHSIREQVLLASTYAGQPWLSASQRADILYRARRGLRRDPHGREQFLQLEQRLGGGNYFIPAVKYFFQRPVENLQRSMQKRRFRWEQGRRQPGAS